MATKKTKGPGPVIPPELKEQYKEQVRGGLKKAAKVIVPMVGATVAMFARKRNPEERALSQEKRAAKKLQRADILKEVRPKRSEKLKAKAAKLTTKAKINKAKSPLGKLQTAASAKMPKNLSDLNKGKENLKIQGGLKKP
jgi:cytochrome c556